MHKFMIRVAAIVLGMLLLAMQAVWAMPETMGTDELYPGMTGKVYTVVDSSGEIVSFDADVIGVIDNGKGASRLIMAKASGPVVEGAGGVLQGMSGSPVYIDGKLVGALSAGIKEMDPYTFFITPIADMLGIWNLPDSKNRTHLQVVNIKQAAELRDKVRAELTKTEAAKAQKIAPAAGNVTSQETVHAADSQDKKETSKKETKALLYISGFGSAGRDFLQKQLMPLGIGKLGDDIGFGGTPGYTVDYNANLQPGSPVGVALVYGDFSVGATGTVTAVDGKRILAFGHPFLHKGNVNYFMTDADVIGTVSGQSTGMKIATVGHIIGRISQDRETGIAGELGVFPSVVPIKVMVENHTLAQEGSYSAQIAYDEDFLPALTAGVAYAALNKTSDNLGESTAKVHFVIDTNAVQGGKIERSNMFYNTSDVGQMAMGEIAQAMDLICSNTDRESDIVDVKVDIDVDGGRQTASIISAIPDKTKVKPGEIVNFKTTIKPYRRDKETLLIPFTVPQKQREGIMHLDVHGGGLIPVAQILMAQQAAAAGINMGAEQDKVQTTEQKIKDFMSADMNNEIVIEPSASPPAMSEIEQKDAMKMAIKQSEEMAKTADNPVELGKNDKKQPVQPPKTKFAAKYIIDNVVHAALQISRK